MTPARAACLDAALVLTILTAVFSFLGYDSTSTVLFGLTVLALAASYAIPHWQWERRRRMAEERDRVWARRQSMHVVVDTDK